jgi:hypothetical protein
MVSFASADARDWAIGRIISPKMIGNFKFMTTPMIIYSPVLRVTDAKEVTTQAADNNKDQSFRLQSCKAQIKTQEKSHRQPK